MPLTPAGSFDAELTAIRTNRAIGAVTPTVLTTRGEASELQPPGSVAVVVAPAGSAELARLAEAVRGNDLGAIEDIVGRANRAIADRTPVGFEHLSEVVGATSSFVDVSYAGAPISSTLFAVDGVPVTRAVLPYAGGALDADRFQAVEYAAGEPGAHDVLIVVHEPEPNDVVERVLAGLPADSEALKIGVSAVAEECTATATPVVVAVTVAIVATAVTSCAPKFNDSEFAINPAEDLADIAPQLGVRQLVAMRQAKFAV
ncbi:MAG: hypothetical protein HOQ24_06300 [Mycobacteriaceae bacterium]|nr:hypothetical protein [Mycobacteriaceae bacterium]